MQQQFLEKTNGCKITIIQSSHVKECFNAVKEQLLIKHIVSYVHTDACILENMKK